MSLQKSVQKTDPFELVGSVIEGEYLVQEYIAQGGFGVVYKGLQQSTAHHVAIKVLKLGPDLRREQREMIHKSFVDECQITARIAIPNIVQAFATGELSLKDGTKTLWLALQWIEGLNLRKWLNTRPNAGKMTPRDTLDLMRPIFQALGRVHKELQIAHRDIKPDNIMVTEHRGFRDLYLLDFGIAKVMQDGEKVGTGLTATSSMPSFSPKYGAAEQLQRFRSGPWTDVHALALIMTELLTDQRAYQGDDPMAVYAQILSPDRPTPAALGVDVGAWEPIIKCALSLDPRERYPDALEFLAALETARPDVGRSPVSVFEATMLEPPKLGNTLSPQSTAGEITNNDKTPIVPPEVHYRNSAAPAQPQQIVVVEAPVAAGNVAHVVDRNSKQSTTPFRNFAAAIVAVIATLGLGSGTMLLALRKGHSTQVVRSLPTRSAPVQSAVVSQQRDTVATPTTLQTTPSPTTNSLDQSVILSPTALTVPAQSAQQISQQTVVRPVPPSNTHLRIVRPTRAPSSTQLSTTRPTQPTGRRID